MKSIISTGRIYLCTFLFFIINTHAQETEKVNLSAGVGYPEAINLGLRYQIVQSQLGLFIGAFPVSDGSIFTAGGDYSYHFAGSSDYSARKPWYVKAGLNYLHEKDEYDDNKYFMLVPRIGRDLNLSSKVGIAVEAGIFGVLSRNETQFKRNPNDEIFEFIYGVSTDVPDIGISFGVNIFYRL